MDTLENLVIRACKSGKAVKRLLRIHKRFYLCPPDVDDKFIESILCGYLLKICESYTPIRPIDLAGGLAPDSIYDLGEGQTYYNRLLRVLISHIAKTEVVAFKGFRVPARFKRKQELSSIA